MLFRSGEVALKVEVTDKVKEGIVFTTFHFPEHMVNMVTGHGKDEETMCAEYKVSSVQVQKNSKNTKDKKDDDWWRKDLGIDDNEKTPKKIRIKNNYSQAANENDINPSNGLISKIKRLKKLYNNGTLTKTEFEKAKNKLLK